MTKIPWVGTNASLNFIPENPACNSYFDFLYFRWDMNRSFFEIVSLTEFIEGLQNLDFYNQDEITVYVTFYNLLAFRDIVIRDMSVFLADQFDMHVLAQQDFRSQYFEDLIKLYFFKNVNYENTWR